MSFRIKTLTPNLIIEIRTSKLYIGYTVNIKRGSPAHIPEDPDELVKFIVKNSH